MGLKAESIILLAVGFLLVAVLTPIGMTEIMAANVTDWNASIVTIFQVLLPIIYIVGAALYFIPKIGK